MIAQLNKKRVKKKDYSSEIMTSQSTAGPQKYLKSCAKALKGFQMLSFPSVDLKQFLLQFLSW